jgi:hypothetical protein
VEYALTINDTNYIQCTSRCSQITVSFSQPLSLSDCQQTNDNTDIYDYALACGVEYHIDYDRQEIEINFQATNDTGSLDDQKSSEFIVQTIWLDLSPHTKEKNVIVRKYGCSTGNDCAKKHYLNSINYFVTEVISQLELIRVKLHNDSLLTGFGSRRRCIDSTKIDGKPSVKCPDGLCHANFQIYELNEERNQIIQRCDLYERPHLVSEIEHHTPKSPEKQKEFLKYSCNKNVCNRKDFIDRIKILINDSTNPTGKIQDNKPITEKKASLSIKQTISSYVLVLFLFLIQLFI